MKRLLLLLWVSSMAACDRSPSRVTVPPVVDSAHGDSVEEAIARIGPAAAANSHIDVRAAEGAVIQETLTLYGTVKSNAERQQAVRARFPGVVKAVMKRVGDRVARGAALLSIESNDSLEPYAITAPMAGTVIERNVNPGESVDGSATLMRLADLSTMWVEFAVFPRDIGSTRPGMPIVLASEAGERQLRISISHVAPIGSGETHTVTARAVLDNAAGQWRAGQFVSGVLEISRSRVPVAVAPDALQRLGADTVVFVQTDRGFVARKVDIGRRDALAVEIRGGLQAGERYAAANSYLVKAELQKDAGGAG